jgi:hypothetical protein
MKLNRSPRRLLAVVLVPLGAALGMQACTDGPTEPRVTAPAGAVREKAAPPPPPATVQSDSTAYCKLNPTDLVCGQMGGGG